MKDSMVIDPETGPISVAEVKRQYQAAHPAWSIIVRDLGDQVYIGTLSGTGLFLDKVCTQNQK